MLSKLFRINYDVLRNSTLLVPKGCIKRSVLRVIGGLVPPNQYESEIPNNLRLGYVLRVHWEVDVVYNGDYYSNSISRTMDLRNPTWHKIYVVREVYQPWPEMQDVLDKMKKAEKIAILRADLCPVGAGAS